MNSQPECVIDEDGTKQWFVGPKRHREDGPAWEDADGSKSWWINGRLHREDGPSVEGLEDGTKQWFLNGEEVEPEALVDLQLSRGVFCYYDEEAQQLIFGDNNE